MSFGDGIGGVCQSVADKHGNFWAAMTLIAVLGSCILCAGLIIGAVDHSGDFQWHEGYRCPIDGELFGSGYMDVCPRHGVKVEYPVIMRREWHDLRLHELQKVREP